MSEGRVTKETAINILRKVSEENAFFFYESVDAPIGMAARSLEEFVDLLKSVEPSSITFHMARADFENWLRMLGDQTLAKQMASLQSRGLSANELRKRMILLIRLRLGRLRKIATSE